MLNAKRDTKAAKRFFKKVLKAHHTQTPRALNVDENAAYVPEVGDLKQGEQLTQVTEIRQNK